MILGPSVPAALVENSYVSNPSEAELFAAGAYIRTAAVVTTGPIAACLRADQPGSGFVQQPSVLDPVSPPARFGETALQWSFAARSEARCRRAAEVRAVLWKQESCARRSESGDRGFRASACRA